MSEAVEYWLEMAYYDLETAEAMLQTKRYLYVGFMCHQVVEKSLKAVIASKGDFPPKIHNLLELIKNADLDKQLTEGQKVLLRELNPLNIEARYPTYINGIKEFLSNDVCGDLLKKTKEWYTWIRQQL